MADDLGLDGPDESMAATLDVAAAALLSVWDAARERAGGRLSTSQLRAMMVIEEHDGINLRGLGTRLGMLLSSASRLCDRLVAAGVLEREPGRVDRREISLHLTPTGQAILDGLRRERRGQLADVLRGMSPHGRQSLLHGLWEFAAVAARSSDVTDPEGPRPGGGEPDPGDRSAAAAERSVPTRPGTGPVDRSGPRPDGTPTGPGDDVGPVKAEVA